MDEVIEAVEEGRVQRLVSTYIRLLKHLDVVLLQLSVLSTKLNTRIIYMKSLLHLVKLGNWHTSSMMILLIFNMESSHMNGLYLLINRFALLATSIYFLKLPVPPLLSGFLHNLFLLQYTCISILNWYTNVLVPIFLYPFNIKIRVW